MKSRKGRINYKKKVEQQYTKGDLRAAWKGIKSMASIDQLNCEPKQLISINGTNAEELPNAFNSFFCRFERTDLYGNFSKLCSSVNLVATSVIFFT